MTAKQESIERKRTGSKQSDRCSHDDQFKGRQPAERQVPANDGEPGKRIPDAENRNRDTHYRAEKSDQKAGAAQSQCRAGKNRFDRTNIAVGNTHNPLRRGHGSNHDSHH